jgi:signal transduction histidine kinase
MPDVDAKLFPKLTAEQIERLSAYGEQINFSPGETLFEEGGDAYALFVIVEGDVRITRRAGNEEVPLTTHSAGAFTGDINLITGDPPVATGRALTPTRAVRISRDEMFRALAQYPDVRTLIIPTIAARRHVMDTAAMQREKLAALGKLSAGLAHELNNPATAASRAASQLEDIILRVMAQAVCLSGGCGDEAEALVKQLLSDSRQLNASVTLDALERSDREEEVSAWMQARGVANPWQLAPDLVGGGITIQRLDSLASLVSPERVGKVVSWLGLTVSSLGLVTQIELSTSRMSDLIRAIKAFTYMDQGSVQQVLIHDGLDATLTILGHKLRNVSVIRDYDPALPAVTARGGDLSQVWANIIVNAIDAMHGAGELKVRTRHDHGDVIVEIADNGPGIPDKVVAHIFEPFFTTKGVGNGTGLGLDTVYRIIEQHHGDITVRSRPGETIFRIRLPLTQSVAAAL